jgi:hypothetical protein
MFSRSYRLEIVSVVLLLLHCLRLRLLVGLIALLEVFSTNQIQGVKMLRFKAHNVVGQVTVVRAKSDGVNASLCDRRERIEELNGTRSLLRKIQVGGV